MFAPVSPAALDPRAAACAAAAKQAFRASLVGAADPFAPFDASGRSAVAMIAWGLLGGDLGDGPFAYEPCDARNDLVVVLSRAVAMAGTDPVRLRTLALAADALGNHLAERAAFEEACAG